MVSFFDTTIATYSWETTYPIDIFPGVWERVAKEISAGRVRTADEIFAKIRRDSRKCHDWLRECRVIAVPVDNILQQKADQMRSNLGIGDEGFGIGVSESELMLAAVAATAEESSVRIITDDVVQTRYPEMTGGEYNLRTVCHELGIQTVTFAQFLRELGKTF